MTKVSASTLARQAAKTKNPVLAKKLRAQAAKLRRDERGAKHKMTGLPDREAIIKRVNQRIDDRKHYNVVAGMMQPDEAANDAGRAASADHTPLANAPGHGEIVGGYLAHMAEELAKLARKKGGVDAIQGRLMTLEHQNRHDEKFYARQREQKAVQAVREEMRDKALCGLIALVEAANQTKSMMPVSFISSDMVGHIVDALRANGYSANGKR